VYQRLTIGALAFAACSLAHATVSDTVAAAATDDASDPLNEIVVVANRAPSPLSKVGNSVTVLGEVAIEDSQASFVADLLATTPGVTFARNGGVGQPASVFIRGAESDQTVVLIDGVQLNDPSTTGGGFDFANLLMGDISRIEILRGAQSTLYGSQAIGGVISIDTAQSTTPLGGSVTVEGGSNDTRSINAAIGGKGEALQWRLAGNWLDTRGISAFDERLGGVERDGSKLGGASGTLRYDFTPDLQLDVRGYYTEGRTEFDGYDTNAACAQTFSCTFGDDAEYSKINQELGYAGLTLKSPDRSFTNRVAFQYTNTETREYDPNAPLFEGSPSTETFYGIGRNEREEYQGTWAFLPGYQAVFGAQHERSTISTDSPAFDYSGPAPLDNNATIDSGYMQIQGEVVKGLTLTAGERYDRHNVYGGHTTGQAAAAWVLDDGGTVLRSSFGQGFKAPSLYQLYSQYGNSTLQPEQAHSWDAGIEQHLDTGRVTLSATYFQRASRDLIEFFDCPAPNAPLCATHLFGGYYANIASARARGVELQGAFSVSDRLLLSANDTYTDATDRSPDSTTFGNELPRRPKESGNLSASYHWPVRITTDVAVRYGGRDFDDAANSIALGGYVLVDLRAAYALQDHLEIYARIDNLTGRYYEMAYQYGSLGRQAFAGIRASF
jgi:vitamin B12 transporter